MNFVHVSMDLDQGVKNFIPRIPIYRCEEEDNITPRICVCKTLEGAVGAFPYKGYFVNVLMRKKRDVYLNYYELESENYRSDKELQEYVPDAHITGEHWILNPVLATSHLIKIKKLVLSRFNKYTNTYSGAVKELEYENCIEDFDRVEEFIFLSKSNFNKFKKLSNKNNIKFEILEDKHMKLAHYYCSNTTKNYRWIKVKAFVPAGADLTSLWLLNDKQNDFAIRKKILFREAYNFDEIEDFCDCE